MMIDSGADVSMVAMVDNASGIGKSFILCCTSLNPAAAMLKISGQSDPDLQRYLRCVRTRAHTQTHTHTHTHPNPEAQFTFSIINQPTKMN